MTDAVIDFTERYKIAGKPAVAVKCGARPERCAPPEIKTDAKPNYKMECPTCGRKWYRYRMKQRNFGSKCPHDGTEVKIYKLTYRRK